MLDLCRETAVFTQSQSHLWKQRSDMPLDESELQLSKYREHTFCFTLKRYRSNLVGGTMDLRRETTAVIQRMGQSTLGSSHLPEEV